jgi:hypothetical protein
MTLEEFVRSVKNEEPIFGKGYRDGDRIVEGWYAVDPTDLEAITTEALKMPGVLPPGTEWDDALRIIDEAFAPLP